MCISFSCSSLSDVPVQISQERRVRPLQSTTPMMLCIIDWPSDDSLGGLPLELGLAFILHSGDTPFSLVPKPYFPKLSSFEICAIHQRVSFNQEKEQNMTRNWMLRQIY